ncbi:MAG: hypothetical protein ACE5G2_03340 [Candidatus Krumholzibacteriia bacterium]
MFDLVVSQSAPPAHVRHRAVALLAGVLATQAALAYADVRRRRDYLLSEIASGSQNHLRILDVDLQRAESLLDALEHIAHHPESEASARLRPLLQLVGGPVQTIELATDRLGARVTPSHARDRNLRILLLPEGARRRRVQIQDLDRVDPQTLRNAAPRCYGELGHSYIAWALNRLDMRSLVLIALAYLRVN